MRPSPGLRSCWGVLARMIWLLHTSNAPRLGSRSEGTRHVRSVARQQRTLLVLGRLSWLSIRMKQAAMYPLLLNQLRPGASGKVTASWTSCLRAWYLHLSSPGFFTSMSQAKTLGAITGAPSIYIVKQYSILHCSWPSTEALLGSGREKCLVKNFNSLCLTSRSLR